GGVAVAVNDEGPDSGPVAPLLLAIDEMREVVNRLIDEQKALLHGRDAGAAVHGPAAGPSPADPGPMASPTVLPVPAPAPVVAARAAVTGGLTPRPRRAAAPSLKDAPAAAAIPAPAPTAAADGGAAADAPGVARNGDPRRRLDALARLLDQRVKQSAGTAAVA